LDEVIDFSPALRAEALRILDGLDHGPLFQPPSERGAIAMPGWQGGANWQGAGIDPETGYLYVPSRTAPITIQVVPGDPARSDFRYTRGGTTSAAGPDGLPLVQPPYARLTAIDMNTGDHAWQVPLGDGIRARLVGMGIPDPGPVGGGTFTGPLVTRSFLFLGHTGPREGEIDGAALLAVDKATGQVVRVIPLPASPQGTPMTYTVGGRQYIVVAVGTGDTSALVALAIDP
jgi:quinoprotein glucose dehydrogenase